MFRKILLGCLIYLVFMLALFPAKVALKLVTLPSQVQIAGVSGTVWNGSAVSVRVDGRQFEQLHWQLAFLPLLMGHVETQFSVGDRTTAVAGRGIVSWSSSGIGAENLRLDAPMSFITGKARLPFQTKVNGELSLNIPHLAQGQPWCDVLTGKVLLNQLTVKNQFGDYPLGNLQLGLACEKGEIIVSADEKGNDLGVQGNVAIGANNKLSIVAKIRETDAQPTDLKTALTFLGRADNQGYYPIRYSGVIPRF